MTERVFVVGVGMTDFVKPSARPEWDYPDMVREATSRGDATGRPGPELNGTDGDHISAAAAAPLATCSRR